MIVVSDFNGTISHGSPVLGLVTVPYPAKTTLIHVWIGALP